MTENFNLPIVFLWPGQDALGRRLVSRLGWEEGEFELRRFPDGESFLRVLSRVSNRETYVFAPLDQPDTKLFPLLSLAGALRDMGCASVRLIAPYLAYMRQDKSFFEGEAVSSKHFAKVISASFDALVTVDPHLHRYVSLGEIYSIPCLCLSASHNIADWVRKEIEAPIFVGPDSESRQWVSRVASLSGAPYFVAEKIRKGDHDVEICLPEFVGEKDKVPVLVDDIISTARTMVESVTLLRKQGWPPPVCVGVHGIFTGDSYAELMASGAGRIATSNSLPHPSNQIDLCELLAKALEGNE